MIEQFANWGRLSGEPRVRAIGAVTAGVGLVATIVGGWLFLGAPSDEDIDDAAGLQATIGPSSVSLSGAF